MFFFFIESFLFNCIFIHILTHKRYRKQFLTTPSRNIQCLSLSSQCLASSSSYRLSLSSTTEVSVFPVQIKVRPFRGCCQRNFPTLPSLFGQMYDIFVLFYYFSGQWMWITLYSCLSSFVLFFSCMSSRFYFCVCFYHY